MSTAVTVVFSDDAEAELFAEALLRNMSAAGGCSSDVAFRRDEQEPPYAQCWTGPEHVESVEAFRC